MQDTYKLTELFEVPRKLLIFKIVVSSKTLLFPLVQTFYRTEELRSKALYTVATANQNSRYRPRVVNFLE